MLGPFFRVPVWGPNGKGTNDIGEGPAATSQYVGKYEQTQSSKLAVDMKAAPKDSKTKFPTGIVEGMYQANTSMASFCVHQNRFLRNWAISCANSKREMMLITALK